MFMRHAACLVLLCNGVFLLSMDQQPGFIIPYNQSLLNFRKSINPDSPSKAAIELRVLNAHSKQENQEPLQKSLMITKDDYMHRLYKKVSLFLASRTPGYDDLLGCINACNYAKRYTISEDVMGAFAFHQDNLDVNQRVSLFFYFLKDYNVRAATTREVPFKMWSPLAKRLNIVSSANAPRTAIELLIDDVNNLILKKIPHYHKLISLIHSNKKFAQLTDKVIKFGEEWKNQFLYDAFEAVCSKGSPNKLHDIVAVVNQAKKEGLIETEIDLGYTALFYEPTWEDILLMKPLSSVDYDHKRKIALVCSFIEKYNTARLKKITPSLELYCIYNVVDSLHILLPDAFDKDLLNPEKIAFAEYHELLDDIDWLERSYPETREECVKELYPPQLISAIKK